MAHVLRDLERLKRQTIENENKLRSSGIVGKLNADVERFKRAAMKMAKDSEVFIKELKTLRHENTAMKEEKGYLSAATRRHITINR